MSIHIYIYIPVNEQFARSNLSMLPNSSMSKGSVNPMLWPKLILTPFVFFISMIEIGSSPERIKDDTKGSPWSQLTLRYVLDHWVKLRIYQPVSWFSSKRRNCNFVNLSNPGGIGPIQSQDKVGKKGRWWTGSPQSFWRSDTRWRSWVKIVEILTSQLVFS